MDFKCTYCGACCNRIKQVAELVKNNDELRFPHRIDKNGKCEKLNEDNRCSVYEERPMVCNVGKMQVYMNIPKEKFYELQISACNAMIVEDKLDDKYLIRHLN